MSDQPTQIGDYHVEALLGEGGMAKVYRARHVMLDTVHAIKVLNPELRVNPEARRRFLDEARIQAKYLDHPNIVKVTTIVATADHAALVMELVDGGNLESRLAELGRRPDRVVPIMLGVLDAMAHAHAAGVIHRDLKPTNVLLVQQGERWVPKVTDFGIAKVSAELAGTGKKSTQGSARMGTLGYMSPEQIRGAKQVTARSDVFALGAILYELATGTPPFSGDSDYDVMDQIVNGRYEPPERSFAGISPTIADVIRRALATNPEERFASCEDMAAALRAAAPAAAGAAAASPSPRPRPSPSASTSLPASASAAASPPAPATASTSLSARPPSPPSRPWLLVGLVTAGAALGGAAVFVALSSSKDAPARATGALALDAGDRLAETTSLDAGVASALLAPPDEPMTPPAGEPGASVPGAQAALAIGALAGPLDPLAPVDAGVPEDAAPAVHPCVGKWAASSGARMNVTASADGEGCGSMTWKMCRGPLVTCTWTDGAMRARYRCTGSDYKSVGTMRFTCKDTSMTVVDKDDEMSNSVTTRFRRR
jgi:serine/threonine-protein kinase